MPIHLPEIVSGLAATSRRWLPGGRTATGLAGFWCLVGYAALAAMARQPGEPSLGFFFLVMAWCGLPVPFLYLWLRSRGRAVTVSSVLLWAVAFRLCGLFGGPLYEDDYFRYLWDGYRFAETGSPYGHVPEDSFDDPDVPAEFGPVLDGINNPDLPTIYAPVTQLVFLAAYWIQPASVTVLQTLLVLVDLACLVLLLRLTTPLNAMLYAWCPLVIKEIAFTAHPDGVGVCLLLLGIVLWRTGHRVGAAAALGLAVAAKVLALVVAPLILLRGRIRHWAVAGLVLAVAYAPFAASGGTGLTSLGVFAREWVFNPALFGLLAPVAGHRLARLILGAAFALFWLWYGWKSGTASDTVPRGDWLFGALLAVSPVINPWYLLWLLPFAAVYPTAWAWTASLSVLLSYSTGLNLEMMSLQPYAQPPWVRPIEFGVILVPMAWSLVRRVRAAGQRGGRPCTAD